MQAFRRSCFSPVENVTDVLELLQSSPRDLGTEGISAILRGCWGIPKSAQVKHFFRYVTLNSRDDRAPGIAFGRGSRWQNKLLVLLAENVNRGVVYARLMLNRIKWYW